MSRKSVCRREAVLRTATVEIPNQGTKCGVNNCSYVQCTFNTSNFVRHFKALHPREYNLMKLGDPVPEDHPPEKKKRSDPIVSVAISKATFIGALVKLVTIHCLPFASMMWSGFRDIINPISNALGVVVNSHNIRDFVNNTAQNIKKIIRSEVSEKIICLKVDAASKLYRSVLGVNCQYMLDGKLEKRTLGVIELFERHTGENLCKEVFKLTTEYGIQKSQIFSVTVDNGANMIKMIKSMNECVSKEFFQEDGELPDDEIINEMAVDPDELEAIDYATNNLMENLEKVVIENGALCVRCGAHTLQLVVNEVCKAFDEPLKGIAKIAKKLRCGEFKRIFEITKGVKLPHIPVKTRWNTNYVMLRDFLEQKEFFINLGSQYKESDLTQYWHFIENYVEAFEPIYEATIIIQKKDCSLSEFYYHWQKAICLVSMLDDVNVFKQSLMTSFEKRDKTLLESHALRAALYLDPRFNYAGSKNFTPAEKEQIVDFLVQLSSRISRNNSVENVDRSPENSQFTTQNKKLSLRDFLDKQYGPSAVKSPINSTIENQIRDVQFTPQQDPDDEHFDVRQYWMKAKYKNPLLWKIADTILAIPATQCSVERDFSFFNLILTKQRSQLSSKHMENVMQVRTNSELINSALKLAFEDP